MRAVGSSAENIPNVLKVKAIHVKHVQGKFCKLSQGLLKNRYFLVGWRKNPFKGCIGMRYCSKIPKDEVAQSTRKPTLLIFPKSCSSEVSIHHVNSVSRKYFPKFPDK